jgi:hypothetical protein
MYKFRSVPVCRHFPRKRKTPKAPMLDQFAGLGMIFAVLACIAMLVRYERRLNRWLQKGSRKRRKLLIAAAVR